MVTITFDKSQTKRDLSHYFAQWISIGWMFFYLMLPLILFVLFYHARILFSTILFVIMLSALSPVTPRLQPEWGWQLGDWCVKKASEYFHIKVIVEDIDAIKATGPAIIAMEPHDVLPISIFSFNECLNALPGHNCLGCVTSACFSIPIMRHMYTWFRVTSVDRKNIEEALTNGQSPVLVPGGVAENTYSFWVPSSKFIHSLGRMIGFLPMIFLGMWSVPFGPAKPCDYTNIVGPPITVSKCAGLEPSQEEILCCHSQFIKAIEKIFEEHKHSCGMSNITLRIV